MLSQSYEDVRLAWQWATKHEPLERVVELVLGLMMFFIGRNWLAEGEEFD